MNRVEKEILDEFLARAALRRLTKHERPEIRDKARRILKDPKLFKEYMKQYADQRAQKKAPKTKENWLTALLKRAKLFRGLIKA